MSSPFETDDATTARTLMIHELSEALLGESFARSERPEEVWADLLGAVRSAANVVNAYDPQALQRLNVEVLAAREVVALARAAAASGLWPRPGLTEALADYDRAMDP